MSIPFKLRFDRNQINEWSSKYIYPSEDAVRNEIAPRAKKLGHLSKSDFVTLCRWKSPRTTKLCQINDEDFIRAVTSTALSSNNEQLRIKIMTLLAGVEWPTASTILHFCSTDRYPILDFRALWSLGVDVPDGYDFEFWWEYTMYCRRLADQVGVEMRILDRALWQYSKEKQKAK